MEKKKIQLKNSKLSLKKESIAKLSNQDMASLRGGEQYDGSTCHQFTCSWCTGSGDTGGSTRTEVTCNWCTTLSVSVSVS
jgi:natural product precursor